MQSRLIAAILCLVANLASAQAPAPAVVPAHIAAGTVHAGAKAAAAVPATKGGEIIKTAAAGTREDLGAPRGSPVMRPASPQLADSQEHPRHNGTAMLLAALALMTGIALRRSSSK